jgi:hypothetical protein
MITANNKTFKSKKIKKKSFFPKKLRMLLLHLAELAVLGGASVPRDICISNLPPSHFCLRSIENEVAEPGAKAIFLSDHFWGFQTH